MSFLVGFQFIPHVERSLHDSFVVTTLAARLITHCNIFFIQPNFTVEALCPFCNTTLTLCRPNGINPSTIFNEALKSNVITLHFDAITLVASSLPRPIRIGTSQRMKAPSRK